MKEARVWLITGEPRVGKTTVLMKTIDMIRAEGFTVGGVISRELRGGGGRSGFELLDLSSGVKGVLASTGLSIGPRFGKYRVNLHDLTEVGAKALLRGLETSDLVVCDEIGPMEFFSPEFKRAVKRVMDSSKLVLGVIHRRIRDPLIEEIRSSPFVEVVEVTLENRAGLPQILASKILGRLKSSVV